MAGVRTFGRKLFFLSPQAGARLTARLRSTTATQMHSDKPSQKVKPFEEMPGPKGVYNLPVIGPLFYFKPFTEYTAETINHLTSKMIDKYGPIYRMQLMGTVVITANPDDVETVFRNEGRYPERNMNEMSVAYCKRNGLKNFITELQGEEWHALRSPLNKRLMKVDSALYYLENQNRVTDDFVKILGSKNLDAEELSELFFRYAAESIAVVTFNARLGFLDDSYHSDPEKATVLEASRNTIQLMNKSNSGESVAHKYYRNKAYREFERCVNIIKDLCYENIERAKKKIEAQKKDGTFDPDEPNLTLSLLSDNSIPTEDAFNMLATLYNAGTDSTSKNLQVLFYHLAKNADKQEILHQEVIAAMGKEGPMTKEALANMPYLKACFKESLRLVPPVTGNFRVLPTDVVLSGYRVPAGIPIIMSHTRMCKEAFTEADKFIPERWLRNEDRQRQEDFPRMASLPFGNGPRNCIGRRFAEQEIYLGASKVLQKLRIGVAPESLNTSFVYQVFVEPKKPIKFLFEKYKD